MDHNFPNSLNKFDRLKIPSPFFPLDSMKKIEKSLQYFCLQFKTAGLLGANNEAGTKLYTSIVVTLFVVWSKTYLHVSWIPLKWNLVLLLPPTMTTHVTLWSDCVLQRSEPKVQQLLLSKEPYMQMMKYTKSTLSLALNLNVGIRCLARYAEKFSSFNKSLESLRKRNEWMYLWSNLFYNWFFLDTEKGAKRKDIIGGNCALPPTRRASNLLAWGHFGSYTPWGSLRNPFFHFRWWWQAKERLHEDE